MRDNQLEKEIEAVLFYKSEPVALKDLCDALSADKETILTALENLARNLTSRGIVLISNNDEYSLATSRETAQVIEKIIKDELNRDLSQASLEVLSIIAYRGKVTRKEIEYIRGVNSSYSLRALLLRGLIERQSSRLDERVFLYTPTTDLLLHLGIASIKELPQWQSMQNEMKAEIRDSQEKLLEDESHPAEENE